ncbi:MAG: phosphotransferase [Acidilobus sp.]
MSGCPTSLIDWYKGMEWSIKCAEGLEVRCQKVHEGVILEVMGCGERAIVPVAREPQPAELDSKAEWLNSVVRGEVQGFTPHCVRLARLSELKPISAGLRSTSYEGIDAVSGGKVLVKVMRRLEDDNLEHLVLRYLTERGVSQVPKYICHVSYNNDLYILITDFIEGNPAATFYVQAARQANSKPVLGLSAKIASALVDLHTAFLECNLDFCRPEPITEQDVERWIGRLTWRASWLRSEGASLAPPSERSLIYEAADNLYELAAGLGTSASSLIGKTKTRTHGDLHLYQVIVGPLNSLVITDFEGEPYRMPALKTEKEPIMRDLAALGRSIDYAGIMGEQARTGASIAEISSWPSEETMEWEEAAFEQLLKSYLEAGRRGKIDLVEEIHPDGLAFWIAERASYEVVYELVAKTGYHYVPINAIARLVGGRDPLIRAVRSIYS